jgi:exodeoxyribonuclease VII small subunit
MSPEPTFEELQLELDSIVERLERGDVPVDDAIALWQRGAEVHRLASQLLDRAEGRLEELDASERDSAPPGL